jgi:hypothetical protein
MMQYFLMPRKEIKTISVIFNTPLGLIDNKAIFTDNRMFCTCLPSKDESLLKPKSIKNHLGKCSSRYYLRGKYFLGQTG